MPPPGAGPLPRTPLPVGLASSLAGLGYVAELRDDVATAERHHLASLNAACETRRGEALALEGLAGAASLRNDAVAVGALLGAASALRESADILLMGAGTPLLEATGGRLSPAERIDIDRAISRVDDHGAMDAAFANRERDPQAVVAGVPARVDAVCS